MNILNVLAYIVLGSVAGIGVYHIFQHAVKHKDSSIDIDQRVKALEERVTKVLAETEFLSDCRKADIEDFITRFNYINISRDNISTRFHEMEEMILFMTGCIEEEDLKTWVYKKPDGSAEYTSLKDRYPLMFSEDQEEDDAQPSLFDNDPQGFNELPFNSSENTDQQ